MTTSTKITSPIYARKNIAFLTLSGDQSISTTGTVHLDTIEGDLSLNSYQVTLKANTRYSLQAFLRTNGSSTSTYCNFIWYDVTNSIELGVYGRAISMGYGANYSAQPSCFAIVTPSSDIVVELRIATEVNLTAIYSDQSFAYIESIESVIPVSQERERCMSYLTAEDDTVLATAGTYYKIDGTFLGVDLNRAFTVDATGKVTYNGASGVFHLVGVSDVGTDKACELKYALYKNGAIVPGAETPHDFSVVSNTENVSITTLIDPVKDDYYEVYAKSDTINTTITVKTLLLTFAVA